MTKRVLLAGTVFFFLLAAPATIYYCRGWRLDFKKRKLVQTGALFFHTKPKRARIHLNGKKKKKTNFFFGSALIENLLPGTYRVEIKKEGFKGWQKEMEVEEKKVKSAKNVVLLPRNLKLKVLSTRSQNFWVSPTGEKVLVSERKKGNNESWTLKSLDSRTEVKNRLTTKKEIEKNTGAALAKPPLKRVLWSREEKAVIAEAVTEKENRTQKRSFFLISIDEPQVLPFSLPEKAESLAFLSAEERSFLFLIPKKEGGSLFRKKTGQEKKRLLSGVRAFTLHKKDIYFLDREGLLKKARLAGGEAEPRSLTFSSLPLEKEGNITMEKVGKRVFVLKGKTLFLYEQGERDFEKIKKGVSFVKVSPKKDRVAIVNSHEIEILYLKEQTSQPLRKEGERVFLARVSGEIKNVFWLTNHYLLFSEKPDSGKETRIKALETDNRDRAQTWNLAGFFSPKVHFSPSQKQLFVLSNHRLFFSKSLQ